MLAYSCRRLGLLEPDSTIPRIARLPLVKRHGHELSHQRAGRPDDPTAVLRRISSMRLPSNLGKLPLGVPLSALVAPTIGAVIVLVVGLSFAQSSPKMSESQMAHANGGSMITNARQVTIKIHDYAFVAQRLTVHVGTTVTWANADDTAHTATANTANGFDTGTIQPHASRSITFSKVGVYPYHCAFHAFMTGTITVVS
jgi:plastocyanin